MDLYIFDIDKSLRDLGIGDNSIGKYVKLYVKKFYYRIFKLEKIFTSNNYEKFEKYIENIKIHNQLNDIKYLSKFLFVVINNLLKEAKREEMSAFTLKNITNSQDVLETKILGQTGNQNLPK